MSWRLSDNPSNSNNNNKDNNRSENKSKSRSPYYLRDPKPVDYRTSNSRTNDGRSTSRRSRRTSTSRRRRSSRTAHQSRASADRPSKSRNTSPVAQVEAEEEDELCEDPDYEGNEMVGESKSTTIFTARDRQFYPANFSEREVSEALRNQETLNQWECEEAAETFDNVGGLGETIDVVRTTIRFPLLCPEFFKRFKIKPNRGLIFYGPPGVGKTMMARALVDCCERYAKRKMAFFMRKGSDILNSYVGQSEANLIKLFDAAKRLSPSIIFLDEIDALAPVRTNNENNRVETNVVSTLLALMDGLEDRGMVFVIGATNRLEAIDPALRRPGRFDLEIFFRIPDLEGRKDILSKKTACWGISPSIIETVARKTADFSGADLASLCKAATFKALERTNPGVLTAPDDSWKPVDIRSIKVKLADFDAALLTIQPSSRRQQNN